METHMNCTNCEKLERELLSALAAIEKVKSEIPVNPKLPLVVAIQEICSRIDLSALHEHDAKVREPLVEALEQIQSKSKSRITCSRPDICADCTHFEQIRSIASEVLATVEKQ